MDRRAVDALAVFCADQRHHFDSLAWLRRSVSDGRAVAVVALYLAMTSWYGHQAELHLIAEEIYPGISDLSAFAQEIWAMGMNLARFSAYTRCADRTTD